MNYWLVKSDPETYGWPELVKDKKTEWTGVRNYAARIHLRAMKKGDLVLFYHSQKSQSIVGIAKVSKEFFDDSTASEPGWIAVELTSVKQMANPVTLSEVKKMKGLDKFPLVTISRLSVMPVTAVEFDIILSMGKTKM